MRALVRSAGKLTGSTDGAAAIEFALLVPMLIVLVICTADLGFGIYRYMQVENAAQAGATYAAARGFSQAQVSAAVLSATTYSGIQASPAPSQFCGCASGTAVTTAACNAPCPDGSSPGTYVSASAKATYNTLVPYPMLPNSYDFAAQATVRIQ